MPLLQPLEKGSGQVAKKHYKMVTIGDRAYSLVIQRHNAASFYPCWRPNVRRIYPRCLRRFGPAPARKPQAPRPRVCVGSNQPRPPERPCDNFKTSRTIRLAPPSARVFSVLHLLATGRRPRESRRAIRPCPLPEAGSRSPPSFRSRGVAVRTASPCHATCPQPGRRRPGSHS